MRYFLFFIIKQLTEVPVMIENYSPLKYEMCLVPVMIENYSHLKSELDFVSVMILKRSSPEI